MSLVVLIALLTAPVLFDDDDYPLSTYPMYSSTRSTDVDFVTAYGVDISGNTVRLGLGAIGATDDPLIAAGELRAAIRSGHVAERCVEIAGRIDPQSAIVSVEVVTERHDVIDHTLERPSIVERHVHATCPVTSVR